MTASTTAGANEYSSADTHNNHGVYVPSSPFIISVLFPREGKAVAHVHQIIDGGHNTNTINMDEVLVITWVGEVDTEAQAEVVEEFVNIYLAATPGLAANSDLQELQELIRALIQSVEDRDTPPTDAQLMLDAWWESCDTAR